MFLTLICAHSAHIRSPAGIYISNRHHLALPPRVTSLYRSKIVGLGCLVWDKFNAKLDPALERNSA